MGLPCTGSMGLGSSFVSSRMRVPLPAARITAFIGSQMTQRNAAATKFVESIFLVQRAGATPNVFMNRRRFIQTTALAATATTMFPDEALPAAEKSKGVNWPIGCFNRPWSGDKKNWGYDAALDGIQAAGYKLTGLLTRSASEPLIGSDATPEY